MKTIHTRLLSTHESRRSMMLELARQRCSSKGRLKEGIKELSEHHHTKCVRFTMTYRAQAEPLTGKLIGTISMYIQDIIKLRPNRSLVNKRMLYMLS